MRRRLDLAASLVGRPSVIFLDEPTTGLDPAKREDMWDVVRRLVADGSTVLLTTQYLEEADALADEITVIDHGRVIAHDTPDGLKRDRRRPDASTVRPADPARLDDVARDPRRDRRRARRTSPARGARQRARRRRRRRSPPPSRRLDRRRHRGHRAVPAPAEPRRGLLHPHRPQRRRRRRPRRRRHDHHRPLATPPTAPRSPRPAATAAPAARCCGTALVLAKRSLIKIWRTPEALIDVTLQPIIFLLLFTYIFGGAIAGGSQHDYLQFLLPGILAQTIAMGGVAIGVNLNTDIEKGVFDRFRSCRSPARRRWSAPCSPTSSAT